MKIQIVETGLIIFPETEFEEDWMVNFLPHGKEGTVFLKTGLTIKDIVGLKILKCKKGDNNMPIKFKEVKYFEVEYKDLEHYINSHYGTSGYSVVADMECSNDSSVTIDCVKKQDLDEYEKKELTKFLDSDGNDGSYITSTLMLDLCNKGLIPEGDYLIRVCW